MINHTSHVFPIPAIIHVTTPCSNTSIRIFSKVQPHLKESFHAELFIHFLPELIVFHMDGLCLKLSLSSLGLYYKVESAQPSSVTRGEDPRQSKFSLLVRRERHSIFCLSLVIGLLFINKVSEFFRAAKKHDVLVLALILALAVDVLISP